ncbi:putative RTA1 domain protein [Xylariomycetidae sp. FL2044]|nr:putative RTA1 domain protein [Xylariomycetidae sp. FL2044]
MASTNPDWSVWLYEPVLAPAIVATVLFLVVFLYLTYLTAFKYRAWYLITITIGAALEVLGYALRSYSTQSHQNIGVFATFTSMIVLAPLFVAAGNYLLIGRLIRAVLPPSHHRIYRVPARYLTRIYVSFDVVCFCVQCSGSSLASVVNWVGPTAKTAEYILLAGLALQVVAFSTYLSILMRFHFLARSLAVDEAPKGWLNVLKVVYTSSFLILIRCIYRMIEFAEGSEGYTLTHEWVFWVFEALPMLVAISAFCVWFPSKYLGSPGANHGFLLETTPSTSAGLSGVKGDAENSHTTP